MHTGTVTCQVYVQRDYTITQNGTRMERGMYLAPDYFFALHSPPIPFRFPSCLVRHFFIKRKYLRVGMIIEPHGIDAAPPPRLGFRGIGKQAHSQGCRDHFSAVISPATETAPFPRGRQDA